MGYAPQEGDATAEQRRRQDYEAVDGNPSDRVHVQPRGHGNTLLYGAILIDFGLAGKLISPAGTPFDFGFPGERSALAGGLKFDQPANAGRSSKSFFWKGAFSHPLSAVSHSRTVVEEEGTPRADFSSKG
jgi:hypothetical protein